MKRSKILIPLLAFVFAIASAFAGKSNIFDFSAYAKVTTIPCTTGNVNNDCSPSHTGNVCQISSATAYDTQAHCDAQLLEGQLFRSPM